MKTFLECIPCLIRQTLDTTRLVTGDLEIHEQILREVLAKLSQVQYDQSPPYMAQHIHHLIRKTSRCNDPYQEIKHRFNVLAMELYPELKQVVKASADPLETAARLAIAGNIIDFGVTGKLDRAQVIDTIEDCRKRDFAFNGIKQLRQEAAKASNILYLGDNAGEIVFDQLLIQELSREKIVFVVKGGPVINDATMEDAVFTGLTELVPVMDNGSDIPGTIVEQCSGAFKQAFYKADLIIAKGQGNYETLNENLEKDIFFLLKVKCPVIAREIGCSVGDIVIKRNKQV